MMLHPYIIIETSLQHYHNIGEVIMSSEQILTGLLIIGGGSFSLCAAIFDWDWYMNHRKARFIVKIFGRQGARTFYGILGVVLIILGLGAIIQSFLQG